jgi:hypothetical protein
MDLMGDADSPGQAEQAANPLAEERPAGGGGDVEALLGAFEPGQQSQLRALLDAHGNSVLQRAAASQSSAIKEQAGHFRKFTGWHQATTYFVVMMPGAGAEFDHRRRLLLAGSFLQVLLQILATQGIFLGIFYPTCSSNGQCQSGRFCAIAVCDFCGASGKGTPPIQIDTETSEVTNRGFDPGNRNGDLQRMWKLGGTDWSGGYNMTTIARWCTGPDTVEEMYETCVAPISFPGLMAAAPSDHPCMATCPLCFPRLTIAGRRYTSVSAYHTPLALEIIGETNYGTDGEGGTEQWRGAVLNWCSACYHTTVEIEPLMERRSVNGWVSTEDVTAANVRGMAAIDWLTLLLASIVVAMAVVGELRDVEICDIARSRCTEPPGVWWIRALRLLGFLRRFVFMPMLVGDVSWLVVMKSADALSICTCYAQWFISVANS